MDKKMKKISLILIFTFLAISTSYAKVCSYSVFKVNIPQLVTGSACMEVKGEKFDDSMKKFSDETESLEECREEVLGMICNTTVRYDYKCLVKGDRTSDSWSKEITYVGVEKIYIYFGGFKGIGAEKAVAICN